MYKVADDSEGFRWRVHVGIGINFGYRVAADILECSKDRWKSLACCSAFSVCRGMFNVILMV